MGFLLGVGCFGCLVVLGVVFWYGWVGFWVGIGGWEYYNVCVFLVGCGGL